MISKGEEEAMKVCGCATCPKQVKCNMIDLFNCYAKKKLTIKVEEEK